MGALRTLWSDPAFLKSIENKLAEGGNASSSAQAGPLPVGSDVIRADSHPTHVQVIEIPDADPRVNLPTSTQTDPNVDVIEGGKKESMPRSKVKSSPEYVDNAAFKMTAKPSNLTTLEVKTMNFTSSGGGTFDVEMSDILFGPALQPFTYAKKGKFIYPLSTTGDVQFDALNTPMIVKFANWVHSEIEKRRKLRLKITETTFVFQMALAQLAAAAAGTPETEAGGGAEEPPETPEPPEEKPPQEKPPEEKPPEERPVQTIPDNQKITIQTSRGPRTMTVGDYRGLVADADNWVTRQRVLRPNISETQLRNEAAEKFNLDSNWWDITNPPYHGH